MANKKDWIIIVVSGIIGIVLGILLANWLLI